MPTGKSIVCTLFQGGYHAGLGGFVNSLDACNYQGIVYAGYHGDLPTWAQGRSKLEDGLPVYSIGDRIQIVFALQDTDQMLANVKPALLNQVWNRYEDIIDYVFYFDCDIVVKSEWRYFEMWAKYGVALCEDKNSPVAKTHPLRMQWREFMGGHGIDYKPKDRIYVNGGFVGIHKSYRGFADLWQTVQDHMWAYTGAQNKIGIANRWHMFHLTDQDALNITKDLAPAVSIMGQDAMDFGRLGYVMSHAAGRSKPWQKRFLYNVLVTGSRPTNADKLYWRHVGGPIRLYSKFTITYKQLALKAASFLGRLFTRT